MKTRIFQLAKTGSVITGNKKAYLTRSTDSTDLKVMVIQLNSLRSCLNLLEQVHINQRYF